MNVLKLAFGLGVAFIVGSAGPAAASLLYTAHADTGFYTIVDDPNATDLTGGVIVNLGWDGAITTVDGAGNHFDQLTIFPYSGVITADGTYLLNTFDFSVDLNRFSGAGPFNYSFSEDLEVGAVHHLITIPFTISISSSDTLIFGTSDPMYVEPLFTLDIESIPLGPIVNGGGHVTGEIHAKVTGVPEPSGAALLAAALCSLLGLGLMRRRMGR